MQSPTLLDDFAPTYDVLSRHSVLVAASPARVYQAARHADLGRPWLVRVLMGLRTAPSGLARAIRRPRGPAGPQGGRWSVGGSIFTLIAEVPGEEFVLGIMGRFWTPTGGLVAANAEAFRHPPPPGLAQALWSFRVESRGAGTQLSTETRVRCGDAASRRRFLRYWGLIRLGSGLIRGSMLAHIRSLAERDASGSPPAA